MSSQCVERLSEACLAQEFVDRMELKIEEFILTAYDCLESGTEERVEISRGELRDLVNAAEDISREFRSLAIDPKYVDTSVLEIGV